MAAKKILVVDDSSTVRRHVAVVLGAVGFEVVEAADGEAGAEVLAAASDIAVVVCDVNMPRMNGIEMVSVVKREERHAALPILMLTTEGQPALIKKAKEAGAKGWIVKPFAEAQLVRAVQKLAGE